MRIIAIDFNWELPQDMPSQQEILTSSSASYGFNNQYSGYFQHVHETANEINDITEPEKSTIDSRRHERIEIEDLKFDEDHYAMDFISEMDIQHLLKYKTIWHKELRRIQKNNTKESGNGEKWYEGVVWKHVLMVHVTFVGPLIQEVGTPMDGLDMSALSITDPKESLVKFTAKDDAMMRNLPKKECEFV